MSGFCGFRRINLTQKNNHTHFNRSSNTCDWITLKAVSKSDPKCITYGFCLKRHWLKQSQQGNHPLPRPAYQKKIKRGCFIPNLTSVSSLEPERLCACRIQLFQRSYVDHWPWLCLYLVDATLKFTVGHTQNISCFECIQMIYNDWTKWVSP